jgi:CDP-6-deoxy-D-xylo-4-hexulose-3-dehydrase
MGEGGAVLTKSKELQLLVESFRDWGRDCYCDPGKENTCGKRFGWQLGQLPEGYDHKYTYAHRGYNLKITDIQAACGLAQLNRLPGFIQTRKNNFNYLRKKLLKLREVLILPEATPNSDPSWFGFPITLKESTDTNRKTLMEYLDQNKIGTRLLFAGNATRQPYFESEHYRIAGNLDSTDTVMNNTFWIGVYPGLNQEMLDHVVEQLELYFGVGF